MRQIELTKQAAQDLRRERHYLNSKRVGSGDDFVGEFVQLVQSLTKLPMTGRKDFLESGRVRSLPKWHKLIAYNFNDQTITVFAIRDTRVRKRSKSSAFSA
jgi:plasmid stabilization system protein ParE